MNLDNLKRNCTKLLSRLGDDGYSDAFIARVRRMIEIILAESQIRGWSCYHDVLRHFEDKPVSHDSIVKAKTVIGAIMEFDINGKYPNRKPSCLTQKDSYIKLSPEFRLLVDRYKASAHSSRKKESSIKVESSNASSFLLKIQEAGISSLDGITEEAIITLFFSQGASQRMGDTQRKAIINVIRANVPFDPDGCRNALAAIPKVKRKTKNVQYINDLEGQAILAALDDPSNSLDLRDRAIGKLAYFTGMRSSDIAGLNMTSIDWERDLISVKQQKTEALLELPLRTPVGNAIYDYLAMERPTAKCSALFLSKNRPYRRLGDTWNTSARILEAAGIRQTKGDRKGLHIFRHHLATSLLSNDIPQVVITDVLGHAAPESLEPYLSADIAHLRECALSISRFPVNGEVFNDA